MGLSDRQIKQLFGLFPISALIGPIGIPLSIIYILSVSSQQIENETLSIV